MSIKVIRYRPAYFSGFDEESEVVTSKKELFDISWIKKWSEIENFSRFSLSDDMLMCEFDEGKKWYVIAKMLDPENTLGIAFFGSKRKFK